MTCVLHFINIQFWSVCYNLEKSCISVIPESRPLMRAITCGCEINGFGSRTFFLTEGRLEKLYFCQITSKDFMIFYMTGFPYKMSNVYFIRFINNFYPIQSVAGITLSTEEGVIKVKLGSESP